MANTVRITSGKLRGRVIATPGGKTHPMGERERLALFNMISAYLPGAVVLDAYAGSGALGFEALSRGAKEVLFVDNSPKAESTIIDNMTKLDFLESRDVADGAIQNAEKHEKSFDEKLEVLPISVSKLQAEQKYDVVLADPPYDDFKLTEVEYLINFVKRGGILVLSHPGEAPELQGMTLEKSHKYAGATISIYVKA